MPVKLSEEIVTLALPEFVNVTVCEFVCPVVTLPNEIVLGEAVSEDDMPVPLSAIDIGEFGALLTTEMLPVELPEVVGLYEAVIVCVCPEVRVNGVVTPEMLKPVPLTFTCETVKLAEPLLVRVIVWLFVLPTFVLPKFSLFGEAPSCDCVPEPLSAIVSGEFGPSFATEMLPVAEPVVVGANFAVKLTLWPAVNVVGVVKPEMLKPVPEAVAEFTVTFAEPEFVKVIVCVPLLPTATWLKFTLPGLDVS